MENIMIDSYAFSSLLANDDKFQMIDLIKKECIKQQREEFLFYQAEYSEEKNCIDTRRIYVQL